MSTPHNEGKEGSIAGTVLMPGDPLRAKYIADTYLDQAVLFNSVRNMLGYTGYYKGIPVSVMGSGMGMPSIGIYSYELYKFYGVENIIRIGSAGAYCDALDIMDIALADSAWSESTFAMAQANVSGDIQYPTESLNEEIRHTAEKLAIPVRMCRVHSSDVFYHEECVGSYRDYYEKHGCACVEMESYALFHNAKILGKRAACLLTISDSFVTHRELSAKERQTSFDAMMKIALETAKVCGEAI
ncbi:purine-nucleoside phosphorylase [Catenibacillus scindens]|uniref:Uridine phosphorylase n=1 Tax=Catenibacillus scindens TaxID=673271 RepID=A0A7W8HAY6_9FIRM|nr:purine-nucleoside phosphorylase [Catenibacillus scindens]MBB5265124.1 purine-nucleoside phosphorylase [Catenibacillus scindens]